MNLRNNESTTKTTNAVQAVLRNKSILYPDLSYKISGICFHVFKKLGPGYQEKHIERAIAFSFKEAKISFREQAVTNLLFENEKIGSYFFDFIVEDKIVVELKVRERFYKKDFDQLKNYLVQSNLLLGLLIRFGREGVVVERVLNPNKIS